jgi:hypothetical protein
MRRILNYIAPLILGASLVASVAAAGCAARVGIYDPEYRDYHRWDGDQDRAYRDYWRERHEREPYRDYRRLNEEQQRDYWKWRHGRAEQDRGRDRDDRDRR